MYQTSNNIYGAKAPSQADLPLKYFPSKGEFTKVCHMSFKQLIYCLEIHINANPIGIEHIRSQASCT